MTYLLKNVAFNTHSPLPQAVRATPLFFSPRARLLSSRDSPRRRPKPGHVTHCAWFPADTGVSCVRGFSNYCFFLSPRRGGGEGRISQETLATRLHLLLPLLPSTEPGNMSHIRTRVRAHTHAQTYTCRFCALPLDVPLGRSAGCVVLLTNVQSARAVKTPRFAGTPVRSCPFFLLFFSNVPQKLLKLYFFFSVRRTPLYSFYSPFPR